MKIKLIKNIGVLLSALTGLAFYLCYYPVLHDHYTIVFIMGWLFLGAFSYIWSLRKRNCYRLTTTLPLMLALLFALIYVAFFFAYQLNGMDSLLLLSRIAFYILAVSDVFLLVSPFFLDFAKLDKLQQVSQDKE